MDLNYIIKYIQENKPYQVTVVSNGSMISNKNNSTTDADGMERELLQIASSNPGVYVVKVKQVMSHPAAKTLIYKDVVFGETKGSIQHVTPAIDMNKVREEIRKEFEEKRSVAQLRREAILIKRKYLAKHAELETSGGKLAVLLSTMFSQGGGAGILGALLGGNANKVQGTTLNVSQEAPISETDAEIHKSVLKLLEVMTVEDFVFLADTLHSKPEYIAMLKTFAPKK